MTGVRQNPPRFPEAPTARCYACRKPRPLAEFAIDRSKASGRASICKACDRAKSRRYYAENRDRKLAADSKRAKARSATAPPRPCARCGKPTPTRRHRYCDGCRPTAAGNQRPGRTVTNGYGRRHQALRKRLAPFVASGRAVCARCERPIRPGEPWDLGHDDNDRRRYTGPEHVACNRGAPGRHRRQSRQW